jgi:V/A-type H+-transporting ATPase subunit C
MSELSSTAYKELVPQTDNAIDALSEFEKAFEMAIYKAINRTFSRMFSFATVIGILKLTTFEIRNLSAIAFAVEQQIPVQTVMSKLVITE